MKPVIAVPLISAASTLALAQIAPGRETDVLTVGLVTTIFLGGGGFFVTQYKAKTAHDRITKFQEAQAQKDADLSRKLDEHKRLQGEQHVGILGAIAALEVSLIDRINAAAKDVRGLDRRAGTRSIGDVIDE